MPRMMKQVAVIQCTKRSKALKRTSVRPERPALDAHHAADQIEDDEQQRACRGWRCRRSSAASPRGNAASRARPAARSRTTWYRGWCRGPGYCLSSCSSCCSLTALAVGLTEVGCCARSPEPPARRKRAQERQRRTRKCATEARHTHPLRLARYVSQCGRRGASPQRRLAHSRSRWSRDRRSASPRRRSRSRACARAPCRSAR